MTSESYLHHRDSAAIENSRGIGSRGEITNISKRRGCSGHEEVNYAEHRYGWAESSRSVTWLFSTSSRLRYADERGYRASSSQVGYKLLTHLCYYVVAEKKRQSENNESVEVRVRPHDEH